MLAKRRPPGFNLKKSKNGVETMSATANGGENWPAITAVGAPTDPQGSTPGPSVPKRRGRPPKAIAVESPKAGIGSHHSSFANPAGPSQPHPQISRSHDRHRVPPSSGKHKSRAAISAGPSKLKGKATIKKSNNTLKKRRVMVSESSASNSSDQDAFNDEDDVDDAQSGVFPTFVSASALSATSSNDSDSSSLSDFDSDSSIEAEEENYILTEDRRARDKARVRRELLGDESGQKMRDPQNNWVIRPRKKSVGLSDVEMDADSDEDATEDEDDDDDDQAEADEDETDEKGPSVAYAGVATGWSEDEESSFDADLFFANLSDSTADQDSSSGGEDGDDGDESDLESMSLSQASLMTQSRPDAMSFEVTHSWDGQMVFTNGLREGQGILDVDFEVNAAQMVVETTASMSQDSDVDMTTSDVNDGEYEDMDDCDLGETDGETTEEELVGPDGLPTERAMKLFRLPFNISAIDPMSTMSPAVSPGPRNRRRYSQCESPKPADILAGRVFWDESDGPEGNGSACGSQSLRSRSRGGRPVMGQFVPPSESPQRTAIIDGTQQDIPSPFPRSRTRIRSASMHSSLGGVSPSSFVRRVRY